jgi:hypothetical protein
MVHFSNYSSKSKVFLSAFALSGACVGLVSRIAARRQGIESISASSQNVESITSTGLRNANTQHKSSSNRGEGDEFFWPFHLDATAADVASEAPFDPATETPAYWKFNLAGSETSAEPYWQNCLGLLYLQQSQEAVEMVGKGTSQTVWHEPPRGMAILGSTSLKGLVTLFFGSSKTARYFTILRHPVDRLVSLYYHLEVRTSYTIITWIPITVCGINSIVVLILLLAFIISLHFERSNTRSFPPVLITLKQIRFL